MSNLFQISLVNCVRKENKELKFLLKKIWGRKSRRYCKVFLHLIWENMKLFSRMSIFFEGNMYFGSLTSPTGPGFGPFREYGWALKRFNKPTKCSLHST